MPPTPSSGPENPAPLTRRTNPALHRPWLRSRRTQTFGLGALCGALGLSLVVVVSSIFAASDDRPPALPEPAPASEARVTPRVTPTPTPTPTPTVEATTPTDAAPDEPVTEPPVPPEPDPVESPPPVVGEEPPTGPGNSGTAPGRTKDPKKP
ncbi:hypothetical protein [Microbacterium cremeum]|uniref:hypothetical protein n=1 Tax=Microbacterium cremeum TaxID=2782169 RepID=UPI001888FC89|nr:hypothetical protein [Microbacterium cremeum]